MLLYAIPPYECDLRFQLGAIIHFALNDNLTLAVHRTHPTFPFTQSLYKPLACVRRQPGLIRRLSLCAFSQTSPHMISGMVF